MPPVECMGSGDIQLINTNCNIFGNRGHDVLVQCSVLHQSIFFLRWEASLCGHTFFVRLTSIQF